MTAFRRRRERLHMPRSRRPMAPSFFTQRLVAGLSIMPFSQRFLGDEDVACFLLGDALLGDARFLLGDALLGDARLALFLLGDALLLLGDAGLFLAGEAELAERRRAAGEHEASTGFQLWTVWLPTLREMYMQPSLPSISRPAHFSAG